MYHSGDPTSLTNATADPFKTLFIARIVSDFMLAYMFYVFLL